MDALHRARRMFRRFAGRYGAALQREGESWGPFSIPSARTDDVDAIATNDTGDLLQVQLTQVEEEAVLRTLGLHRQASLQRSAEKLAAAIQAAVDSKSDPSPQRRKGIPPAQRPNLLLALDATHSPGYVDDAVVARFLADHGTWAAGLGFKAIWLVGLTAERTRRLC